MGAFTCAKWLLGQGGVRFIWFNILCKGVAAMGSDL